MIAERVNAERVFAAMGTRVHLVGVGTGAAALLEAAEERVHHLEAQWSRFRATSELSRLNARAGTCTTLAPETYALVAAAVEGWKRTTGLFDPTLLAEVQDAGYDRSFDQLPAPRSASTLAGAATPERDPGAGCAGIELDPGTRTVFLPAGTQLDLGGIAKGFTADLVVADLAAAGLDGACANLGGDVRVWGSPPGAADPTKGGWTVAIEDPTNPTPAAPLALLDVEDGAVVTSTRLRRRWLVDGVEQHHLIDPRTGQPAFNGWAHVSVIAGTATEAEVLVKAVFLGGPRGPALLDAPAARALLVADDGHVETIGFGD